MSTATRLVERATAAARWLGPPGIVLLAALLVDLAIILPAAVDETGPVLRDLLFLPGVLAISGCALWARTQPLAAAFAGAATMMVSTVVVRLGDIPAYSTVLANVSFAETVAGFELVYLCVRGVRGGAAFVAVTMLVISGLGAVLGRDMTGGDGYAVLRSGIFGLVMLIVAVAVGFVGRSPDRKSDDNVITRLARAQWPLMGVMSLLLFFEVTNQVGRGLVGIPLAMCSVAAAVLAIAASRWRLPAAVLLAGTFLVVGATVYLFGLGRTSATIPGSLPLTAVAAGIAVTIFLIRYESPPRAWGGIAAMSFGVAVAVIANRTFRGDIQSLFIGACMLLGMAVAFGLFLKSRDSERKQVVKSAVAGAQTSERMALARELHDVVAHHVTGIVVQAQAAKVVAAQNPGAALEALERIELAGTEAMTAMRRLVRSMRGDAPIGSTEFSEQATMDLAADLRKLVDQASHGVPTEVELDLPPGLPQEVSRSALRLVQEALTNVGKHATGASLAHVSVRTAGDLLYIRVHDDGSTGSANPPGGSGGYGLVGMRERVALLNGRLEAGPSPEGGWLVEAWLPLEGAE
ncbi:sensor histidine kinase [Amycolatopsis suaedae]|uniref:sensor histidine kinase n=1 Tax=Amycolatopsis suaedae TaxID=2510978 RepID=UPI001F0D0DB8|nr:histidine kinase [Amycolatopsis suaedae]